MSTNSCSGRCCLGEGIEWGGVLCVYKESNHCATLPALMVEVGPAQGSPRVVSGPESQSRAAANLGRCRSRVKLSWACRPLALPGTLIVRSGTFAVCGVAAQ